MKKNEKAPTKIMAQTGPMNDHIVPDEIDSQQLQEKMKLRMNSLGEKVPMAL